MESFLVSTLAVAIAEIGDKTQLLALLLAARFRRPVPIVLGILVATIANHGAAALAGAWLASLLSAEWWRWLVGGSFLAMAAWTLVPDAMDDTQPRALDRFGPFIATLVTFFLVEIGDKTQVATVALAVRFQTLLPVVAGTTLGMMIADVPAVFLGEAASTRIPLRLVRMVAAGFFALMGGLVVAGVSIGF